METRTLSTTDWQHRCHSEQCTVGELMPMCYCVIPGAHTTEGVAIPAAPLPAGFRRDPRDPELPGEGSPASPH